VCEGKLVGVELYATPPRLRDYASALSKAGELAARRASPAKGGALVVLCRGGIGVFRAVPLVPAGHNGWWRLDLGPSVLHVVDASLLDRDGTWGAVRMIADPPPTSDDDDLLAELQRDPRISIQSVARVAEAIMNETIRPSTDAQYRTAAEMMKLEGRRQGRAEGRAEAVLMLADTRGLALTAEQRRRILGCTDLATLDRWIVEAASATLAGDPFR